MKKFCAVLLTVILVLSFSVSSFAADMPAQQAPAKTTAKPAQVMAPSPATTAKPAGSSFPPGPIQKAERGFMNAVYGWTEIPKRIVDKTKEYNNPIKGLLVGGFQGSCKAFARTASGVSELVTFPIGRYDKPAVLPDMPAAK